MEESVTWVVIIGGEADGRNVRVALDFHDAHSILGDRRIIVGENFITQLLEIFRVRDAWVVKTVIEEVKTPQGKTLPVNLPLFALLSKSDPRGLSAGVLFVEEDALLSGENSSQEPPQASPVFLDPSKRFVLLGLSPAGFAAACAEDPRLFSRFISRLLKRPDAFREVSLFLPQQVHPP
ncbi:MAG: hypothetical protein Q6361_06720 [Candidatus Hermodarchaeota archaeon]|nr:hypothetical protein [Candidatus Hermodarchaeota archaeon]